MFYVLTADVGERTALIDYLAAAGVLAVFHYVPLHSSPFARMLGVSQIDLPKTDELSSRLLRLPMYFDLTDDEVEEVAGIVLEFYQRAYPPRCYGA